MSIVSVTIIEDSGTAPRVLRYRITDSTGATHDYGPMRVTPDFDAEAIKPALAEKFSWRLAEAEFDQVMT